MSYPKFRSVLQAVAFLGIAFALSGCGFLVDLTAKRAARSEVRRFTISVNRLEPFMDCLESPGGMCKNPTVAGNAAIDFINGTQPGIASTAQRKLSTRTEPPRGELNARSLRTAVAADAARAALNHDVQEQLNSIFTFSRGGSPSDVITETGEPLFRVVQGEGQERVAKIDFSLDLFEDYMRQVESATLLGGWDALADYGEVDAEQARRRAYIKHYFEAYFREGRFIQVTLSAADLLARITASLKEKIPGLTEEKYKELAEDLFPQYSFDSGMPQYVFGQIDDTGFVTRGGQKMAFPAIDISASLGESNIAAPSVDYMAVGGDLIRVLLHAIFDAEMRVPAMSDATGLTVAIDPLRVNQNTNVDADEFGKIETRATEVESMVSAGVGRLIRGVSVLSLNNEALATAIETAVAVSVRKPVEKALWCWYECKFNKDDPEQDQNYLAVSYGEQLHLDVAIGGFPTQLRAMK